MFRQLKQSAFTCLFVLVCGGFSAAWAQTTATISGTVQDGSGAVITAANVTLTNTATGLERNTTTDGSGAYGFAALPVGSYRVRVEKAGFKTSLQENVVLQIAQQVRLDFSLSVGQTTEQITVSAGVTLANTENAETGEVIDNKRIVDLPLNGRQFMQLAELTPGISRGASGGFRGGLTGNLTGPNITVNGARDTDNYYTIDGVSANDRFFNSLTVSPSIDAIQEFKVQSNLYSAESGVTGGAQINIAIKSGSNDWHGTLFEFFRNDRLNARNYFDTNDRNGDGKLDRPVYQQNQFGFTFGGRIIKDKLFFFSNGEWLRLKVPQTRSFSVPTTRMRGGDFSESLGALQCRNTAGQISACGGAFTDPVMVRNSRNETIQSRVGMVFDPYSAVIAAGQPGAGFRTAYADNIIPQNVWNAASRDALQFIPAPIRAGLAQNYSAAPSFRNHTNQYNGRIDYRLSSKDTVYGRYIHSDIAAFSPYGSVSQGTRGGAALPGFGWDLTTNNRNLAVNYTRVWTGRLITEFRFGYNNVSGGQVHENVGNDYAIRNKVQGIFATNDDDKGIPRFTITGVGAFGDEANTIVRNNEDYQYDGSLSYNVGAHQMKFGGGVMRINFAPQYQNLVRGSFGFGGGNVTSGIGFADFLLGLPVSASAGALARAKFYGSEYYFFAQDNWKIHPRLTFTYGLRYDYAEPLVDRNLLVANFDLKTRTLLIPYDGERIAPDSAFRFGTLANGYTGGFPANTPGFAIKPASALGIHPGLIRPDKNNWAPRIGFAWNVFGDERLVLRTGYGIYYNRKEQFGASTMVQRPPFGYSNSINPPTAPCTGAGGAYVACTPTTPRLQFDTTLVNTAPFAVLLPVDPDMRTGYLQQWNLTAQTNLHKKWLFEAGYVGSKGSKLYFIDSRNYRPASPTVLPANTREFFPYSFGMAVWSDHGFSTYHSLQTRLVRRLDNGLQFSANYTLSKSIDNNSAGSSGTNDSDTGALSQPGHRAAEKARSAFDARHRFVVSGVYQLPFGPGRRFGAQTSGFARKLIEGWQLGVIASWRSATPFTVDSTFDYHNIGRASGLRPNLSGDPNAGPKTAEQWFNTAAFTNPARGVFGTAGRNIVAGDTVSTVDFSALKDIALTEKFKLQFRAELFNVANHTNFGTPNRNYLPAAAGYTAGVSSNINPEFGRMFGASDPRVAQMALKLIF